MKYRRFGKLDWKVSALGFGTMRFPTINNDTKKINEGTAIKMIRFAIDNGVNYLDTAYGYHEGNSEIVVGKALKDGYRKKVKIATKMPTWLVKSRSDMDKFLDEQLTKLQTQKIDFYLLHGLKEDRWIKMKTLNVFEWAEKAVAEGKINHLGFSFHDRYEVFQEIIDDYDKWALCQIQYNYIDVDVQAGIRGLEYAASKGLAVVVMEPIAGGFLAFKPSKEIKEIWNQAKTKRTPAEWALQWVWNHPEVSLALSGMSKMKQVIENVNSADHSGPGMLTTEELDIISRVKEKYLKYGLIACKDCKYCLPCPQGIKIPKIFTFLNEFVRRRGNADLIKELNTKYLKAIPKKNRAKRCARCGQCEERCPQQLPVRDLISKAARQFESAKK